MNSWRRFWMRKLGHNGAVWLEQIYSEQFIEEFFGNNFLTRKIWWKFYSPKVGIYFHVNSIIHPQSHSMVGFGGLSTLSLHSFYWLWCLLVIFFHFAWWSFCYETIFNATRKISLLKRGRKGSEKRCFEISVKLDISTASKYILQPWKNCDFPYENENFTIVICAIYRLLAQTFSFRSITLW